MPMCKCADVQMGDKDHLIRNFSDLNIRTFAHRHIHLINIPSLSLLNPIKYLSDTSNHKWHVTPIKPGS